MKNILLFVGICLLSIKSFSESQLVWKLSATLPSSARSSVANFTIGEKIFISGGLSEGEIVNDSWEYNTVTKAWTQKADFPGQKRYDPFSFSINGKGYVGNGWANTMFTVQLSDVWEYDPQQNKWSSKSDFPGGARYTSSSFAVNGKGYVMFGYNPLTNDVWEYDPITDTWEEKTPCPGVPRQSASGFVYNNKIYTGCGDNGNYTGLNDWWEYNPANDQWVPKESLPGSPRYSSVAFSLGNSGYVGFGVNASGGLDDLLRYSVETDTWSVVQAPEIGDRNSMAAFEVGDKVWIGLGVSYDRDFFDDLYEISSTVGIGTINIADARIFISGNTLQLILANEAALEFSLFDISGKQILVSNAERKAVHSFSVGELSAGTYIYCVKDEADKLSTGKIFIQ